MKPLFELKTREEIICSDTGVWLRGGLKNQTGQFYLTTQRVIFVKTSGLLTILFGLLGAIVAHWFNKVTFEHPLKGITGVELSSFGFNKRVTLLRTTQGNEKFNLRKPYEEWEKLIQKALRKV